MFKLLFVVLILFLLIIFSHDEKGWVNERNNTSSDTYGQTTFLNPVISPTPVLSDNTILENFSYPNAVSVSSEKNNYVFKSYDGTQDIINWYKDIFKKSKMDVKSFSETIDGTNINSKITGENNISMIELSIKNVPDETYTLIGLIISQR